MKFDMSEAWSEAMAMIRSNREVLLIVAGIFFFLPNLIVALLVPDIQAMIGTAGPEASEALMQMFSQYWWLLLLVALAQGVGFLALLALLRDSAKPTVGDALRTGLIGLPSYLVAYLLVSFGMGIIFAVLIGVPAAAGSGFFAGIAGILGGAIFIYVMVKLSLVPAAIAIDKILNPLLALRRSWALTRGNSLRLFLFFLLIVIAYFVISLVIGMVLGALFLALGDTLGLALNGILSGLIDAALTVILVGVLAALHRQLADGASGSRGSE